MVIVGFIYFHTWVPVKTAQNYAFVLLIISMKVESRYLLLYTSSSHFLVYMKYLLSYIQERSSICIFGIAMFDTIVWEVNVMHKYCQSRFSLDSEIPMISNSISKVVNS